MSFGYSAEEMNERTADAAELLRCAADQRKSVAYVALELESFVVTMGIANMWAGTVALEVDLEADDIEVLLEAAFRLELAPGAPLLNDDEAVVRPSVLEDAPPAHARRTRRSAAAGYSRRRSAPGAAAGSRR